MVRFFLKSTVYLSVIMVFACIPLSTAPLTFPGEQELDRSLVGTWWHQGDGETVYVHIGLDESSDFFRIVLVDFDQGTELETSEYLAHTSSLKGNNYLNLKPLTPRDDWQGYLFVKYTTSSGSFEFSMIESQVIERAIRKGELAGSVKREEKVKSVRITAAQEDLQAFVLTHDAELFAENKSLSRVPH